MKKERWREKEEENGNKKPRESQEGEREREREGKEKQQKQNFCFPSLVPTSESDSGGQQLIPRYLLPFQTWGCQYIKSRPASGLKV
jgi:hypothetical protein